MPSMADHGICNIRYQPTCHPSLPQVMTAIHTRMTTEYLPTWSILTAAGHATGPEISASRWLNCARAILHCWRPTCTTSDVETPLLVHIAMVLTRRQNIWCYTAQHTPRRGGSRGQISTIKATQVAYGASWRGSGRWPVPPTGNEREREGWIGWWYDCWLQCGSNCLIIWAMEWTDGHKMCCGTLTGKIIVMLMSRKSLCTLQLNLTQKIILAIH